MKSIWWQIWQHIILNDTIEGVQAQSTIEGVDPSIESVQDNDSNELHEFHRIHHWTSKCGHINTIEPECPITEANDIYPPEAEETLMVHEDKDIAMGYEAQAQNADDNNTGSTNTETLENDMDIRYGPRSNHYNCRAHHKPIHNNLRPSTEDELLRKHWHNSLSRKPLRYLAKQTLLTLLIDWNNALNKSPNMRNKLTIDERTNDLRYLMFL